MTAQFAPPVLRRSCSDCEGKKKKKLQTKLVVGGAQDAEEQQADQAAEAVMSAEAAPLRRSAAPSAAGGGAAPAIVDQVLADPGQALDEGARAFLEPRFGRDFGAVRVHADARAAASAQAVSAEAYTVGTHVVFGASRYAPASAAGRRLLAHELAHVVQQGGASAVEPPVESSEGAEHDGPP